MGNRPSPDAGVPLLNQVLLELFNRITVARLCAEFLEVPHGGPDAKLPLWHSALVKSFLAARRSERGRQSGITIIAEPPSPVAGRSTSDSKRAPIRINREPGRRRHEWTAKRPKIGPPMEKRCVVRI